MGVWDIVVIVCCTLLVVGVIIWSIVRKKQGKNSCGFYCDGNCSHCSAHEKPQKPKGK